MNETKKPLSVVRKLKEDPKEAVIFLLEDFISQLKNPDHPDPGFFVMFTQDGRSTYNIKSVAEYVGCLELEKASFLSEIEDELESS